MLREIAAATLDALDDGFYYPPAPEDVEQIGAEKVESENDTMETKADGTKEEQSKEEESKEEEDEKSDKGDEQSEAQDGTDEKSQDAMKVEIVDHRKAGREPYDLKRKIWNTNENTLFIPPDDETLGLWFRAERSEEEKKKSRIIIAEYSTLVGSRRLQTIKEAESGGKIGVLNFASAKRAGGGFLNGAQAQVRITLSSSFWSSYN